LRLVFAGTPEFARTALEQLVAAGHTIALVLTQPDRPAGRGMKLQASAVKQFAGDHGFVVAQPHGLRLDGKYAQEAFAAREAIAAAQADAMVVVAYGLILPQWVLDAMAGPGRWGCLNIHGSLLPRWRGAAPIHRAIEAGDRETGVTIMQMDAGLDTGPMLLQARLPIEATDTSASLHNRVAALGARLVVQALADPAVWVAQDQPAQGVSYAHKIEKSEAAIDWRLDADLIVRRVRAFNPFPGASAILSGETLKVWGAVALTAGDMSEAWGAARPGEVVSVGPEGVVVRVGHGALRLTELQRPGAKRLTVAEFVRGFAVNAGMVFGTIDALPLVA
jgi:methionyl-tRNA formyltransferase